MNKKGYLILVAFLFDIRVEINENLIYTESESEYNEIVNFNPFRYRGYCFDSETKLYYLNSRYYDPEIGRFINADDISILDTTKDVVNGLNLYVYCLNNPVNDIDNNGYFGLLALFGIFLASVIIGGTVQIVSNSLAGKKGDELFRGVAGAALGTGFNALALCLSVATGGLSLVIGAVVGSVVQTGVDLIETSILGEKIDWVQTGGDFVINFLTTILGNLIGDKLIKTNSGWFQPQKFTSVFFKSYGQKILLQNVIGSSLSGIINYIKKKSWKENIKYIKSLIVSYKFGV